MNITTPIFLVDAERSGTTLLRLMLDHHPKIAFNYEFEFAVDQIDATGNFPDLSTYYEYLAYHRIFLETDFKIDENLNYPDLVNSFLLQKRDNKPIVGATVHHKFHHLTRIWPQAKFIHLLRDGRDVARSNILMGWAGNMFAGVDFWITAEHLWQKLSSQLAPHQQMTIRYEELIQNPEEKLTQICHFIGVPFDKTMFDYAKTSTYSLPDPKIVERWRKQLTDCEIQLAESKIADLLTERGYPLSGLPLLKITPWLRWRKYIHNRFMKNLFRL
ncbi:sulfotransferase, partial [Candidatus Marithioploca araucensis]|nr:sulfotransferase [Candidatus Marithioploca araucensis]